MATTIKDGPQLLEVRDCPLVRLPDGRPAAIWRGLAYAFDPTAEAIDVSLDGIAPALCRPAGREQPSRAAFAISASGDEAYVLLPGSALDVERAAATLARAGLQVLRTGRHYGDPFDGLAADWFVRVVRPAGGEGLATIVGRALGAEPIGKPAPLERADVLKADLVAARSREAAAREEAAKLRLELAGTRATSADRIAALRAELARESDLRAIAEAEALTPTITEPVVRPPLDSSGRKLRDEVADVVKVLMPPLRLLRDTLDVIASEFSHRRAVYRVLQQLAAAETGFPQGNWKTLAHLEGAWIESHVANGNDDSGRVYARLDKRDRSWAVLVSHKGQQSRDIDWLRRQPADGT